MKSFNWRKTFIYTYGVVVVGCVVVGIFFGNGLIGQFKYILLPALPWSWLFTYMELSFLSDNLYLIIDLVFGLILNVIILYWIGGVLDKKRPTETI